MSIVGGLTVGSTLLGAGIGSWAGSNYYENPAGGALTGGIIGAATPLAIGASMPLLKKAAPKVALGSIGITGGTLGLAGTAAYKAGKFSSGVLGEAATYTAGAGFKIGNALFKDTFKHIRSENGKGFGKLKLTGKGKLLGGLIMAGMGLMNGTEKYMNRANNVGGLASPVPNWKRKYEDRIASQPQQSNPGYTFNGGASGDLVFALNALRNGG